MSEREIDKKEDERYVLSFFLDAYERTTGVHLYCEPHFVNNESPDFICQSPEGAPLGIEITKVLIRPNIKSEITIPGQNVKLDAYAAAEAVLNAIKCKDKKRCSSHWHYPDSTILVIQLLDANLPEFESFLLNNDLRDDFQHSGFREIWVINHDSVESYGNASLFGLSPLRWWGSHDRLNHDQKPYG